MSLTEQSGMCSHYELPVSSVQFCCGDVNAPLANLHLSCFG